MEEKKVDVAIIGTGTAGMGAYRGAKESTDSIALIEGGPYGTTCARVGCMPSKLLIAAAEAVHNTENLEAFGIDMAGPLKVDGPRVMDRVKRERDRFVGFVIESVEGFESKHKIRGYARFLDDHTLMVDEHTRIEAKSIVIATGSSPTTPAPLKAVQEKVIYNDDVFEWSDLPESVAVFGPGVIGLELGQALHRLGVRVTVFGRGGRIGIFTDPQIKDYARHNLRSQFELQDCAQLESAEIVDDKAQIRFIDNQGELQTNSYDWVLSATGRAPNLNQLDIHKTSLRLDERKVPVYDFHTLQCDPGHIFLAGDANADLPLLHEASDEGRIAGRNAGLYPNIVSGHRRSALNIAFTEPNMTTAGKTYAEIQESGEEFVTGEVSFENQGRSRVMLVNRGMMHVYASKETSKFLGAEIYGPRAENLGHLLAWSHQQGLTIPQMLDMPFYHPVIEEGLRTALRDANSKLS